MHAILRGSDHPDLDTVAAVTVADDLAIALSRGRHPKRYDYTDPNEDVVAVRRSGTTTVLIVADGHSGHQASHVAVDALLGMTATDIPAWDRRDAVLAFHEVNEQIRAARVNPVRTQKTTRTTLVVAVVGRDADGQRYVTHASVGDSAVFVVRGDAVYQLTRERHQFLGDRMSAPQMAGVLDYEQTDIEDDDIVLAVSDGYTNFAPVDLLSTSRDRDPQLMACRIIDIAGDAGAGDNVAVAVLLPPAPDSHQSTDDRTA